ncbi:MAG: hypothetical protein KDB53_11965 [Planctomycetes bacterium]|nr:hypothetical protein [Planctomycetota bacterium]
MKNIKKAQGLAVVGVLVLAVAFIVSGQQTSASESATEATNGATSSDSVPDPRSSRSPYGTMTVTSNREDIAVGAVTTVTLTFTPRVSAAAAQLSVLAGPGLTPIEWSDELVSLTEGKPLTRTVLVRRDEQVRSSVAAIVKGVDAKRGAWSVSGHKNFIPTGVAEEAMRIFYDADGRALVGDR